MALFHSAFNMTSSSQNITPELVPGSAAALIPAAAVAVLALLVIVFTRGPLGYEPERAASRPALPSNAAHSKGGSIRVRSS